MIRDKASAPKLLNRSTQMLIDPIEGFLSGIGSSVVRSLLAIAAILAGFATCQISSAWGRPAFSAWTFLSIGLLLWWGTYGAWFLIGLLSLIGMFVFHFAFIQDRSAKLSLFLAFTSGTIYFLPVTFEDQRWICTLCLYAGVTVFYWIMPCAISRIINANASDADNGR